MSEKSSLLDVQKKSIKRMLNLNKNGKSDKIWKVLIIDITGREIISPLFNLNEIRSFGVTLLLLSNSKKEAVSDAISIYFVEPNKENIDNILNDLMEDLYREYYLNFVSSISKEMLSYLAKKSLELGVSDKIKSVYDQFSHFQCLEKRLFSLSIKNSFSKMIKNDQNLAKRIVNGLFDIFVTIKEVPIIKAAKGSMAENIGRKLAEKIRSRSERNEDLFPKKKFGFSFKRTLLILVDRQIDISTMLHHTSTYQALVHDLLNYQNHQVSLEREDFLKNQKTNSTTFELNENDHFWIENKGLPFMDVANAVSKMVNDYRKIQEDFRSQPKNRSQNPNLLETISDLPKIQRQKILTDRHTAVASALSKKLSRRRLAEFFLVEENLIQGKKLNLKKAKSLLSSETPTTNDKLRLLLIYLIKNPENIESFEQIAEIYFEGLKNKKQIAEQNEIAKSGKAISSIKKLLFIDDDNENNNNDNNKLEKNSLKPKPENPINPITNGNDNDQNTFISKFFRKGGINMINSKATELTENLWKNVVDKSAQIFAEVKNMLPTSKLSPLSRIVDEITTNRLSARKENGFLSFSENDEKAISNNKKVAFATIDPQVLEKEKNFGTSFGTRFGREKVIVFVVGGGSYVEFQNLEDFANGKFGVSEFGFGGDGVLYGATEMVAPEDFLVDLENCFVE